MVRHSLHKSLFRVLFSLLAFLPALNVSAAQGGSLEDGLIAHYELNGDGTDSGPNGLHGVPVGPFPTPTTGVNGAANGACLFEGGYFEVEDDSVLTLGTDNFTIATWLRYTALGDFQIMGHNEGSGTHNKWILMASPDGIKFHIFSPPTPLEYPINWTGWSPIVDTWYHVCVRRSGNTYKLFVDGVEKASGSSDLSLADINAPLRIGTSEGSALAGALDEVRLYSRALNDSEVGLLALGGSIIRYGSAASNSVSATGARIETTSIPSLSLNAMNLECHDLPQDQFGVFFYGPYREDIPFGDGYRFVGGPLKRIGLPINTDSGAVTLQLDFTSPPLDQISPGDQFNFQFWYRDPQQVGHGYNLSDALEIVFCP
jgi:hypothetical protein